MKTSLIKRLMVLIFLFACRPDPVMAYSVLTHEALIDAAWDQYISVLLKKKYHLTPDQLKEAHAYAYGGAVSPDMGYYPFGSKLFTNLVHYVRSGDYVMALLDEARNANEYAFALGSLCHYFADTYGHRLGVNVSVPLVYPKVKNKYGDTATYVEDPTAHKRVEFAFDVTQTAKGNYATQAYHDFIGFQVCKPVMDRAFFKTYGMHLDDVFSNFSRAVGTFRWAVKDFFPELTRAAWATKKSDIHQVRTGVKGRQFRYHMSRVNYNKEFGRDRDKPGFFAYTLGVLIKILPKIGPLKPLKFKAPSPVAEKHYIESFDSVLKNYTACVDKLITGSIKLSNKDFDTGFRTTAGEYKLADESYCDLILKLKKDDFNFISDSLKDNMLHFFENSRKLSISHNDRKWPEISQALDELKNINQHAGTK